MEQMILVLVIALLVWLAAGIGRDAGSMESSAFAAQKTKQTSGRSEPHDTSA
jgi:hypothetical protein